MFQKPSPDIALSMTDLPSTSHDEVETVVGPSVQVEGDFFSEGNILVKGIVTGTVQTSKRLTVEPGAKIFANVKAGMAIISGEIKGNVKVTDQLEVTGTARIIGDIECQTLVVEAGALLYGKIAMKGIDMEPAKTARRAPPKRSRVDESSEDAMGDESAMS